MGDPAFGTPLREKPPENHLDSWKEIAAYLDRDVTTVQRWEKSEAMPVHRHVHDKRSSVYALTSELDAWRQSRQPRLENENGAQAGLPLPIEDDHTSVALQARWLGAAAFRSRTERTARPKIKSLAVLPLKNLSGDPEQEYFADGMTEALITELGKTNIARVISRQSVMQYEGTKKPLQEIARELNVDAVLEGTVVRSGDRVRVTVHLDRASPDSQLWASAYDRSVRDILDLQNEIARTVTDEIQVRSMPGWRACDR